MSKELPYFKFFPALWITGNITLEDYEIQGLFINICAYYWERECEVTGKNLIKRFQNHRGIESLVEAGIIGITEDLVVISFLSEQYMERQEQYEKNVANGLYGSQVKYGKIDKKKPHYSPTIAQPKQPYSIKIREDKEEDYNIHSTYLKDIKERKDTDYAAWLSGIYGMYKLKPRSIGRLLDRFCLHLKTMEKVHSDLSGFKKHFSAWLGTQDQKQLLNEYKIRKVGAL